MSDIHLSRDLLAARSRGEVSHQDLLAIALQHLSRHCPHCRDEILAWRRRREGTSPGQLVDALNYLVRRESPRTVEERRQTLNARLRELLALSAAEREARVSADPGRFALPQLAWLLLETCRRKITSDPEEAESLAALAMLILWYCPEGVEGARELLVRAHAYSAACCHQQGDLVAADESIRAARHQARIHGLSDPVLQAEIDALEGALRHTERRLPVAVTLLRRSALLYRISRRPQRAAQVLLRLSAAHRDGFELRQAIEATREALVHLSGREDRDLLAWGRHRLAWYLCEAGLYDEAELVALKTARLEMGASDGQDRCREIWLQGRIAAGRQRPQDAERSLRIARKEFLRQGRPQAAALVTLDLVDLYQQMGRRDEVRILAEALPAALGDDSAQRDVTAALFVFQRAARGGDLTPGLLRRLHRLLEQRFRARLETWPDALVANCQ